MLSRTSEQLRLRAVPLSPPKIQKRWSPRAFTIVELLVTISIVALLVGLMMPGFRAARESANRIQCSSNERQIGIGIYGYAAQNHEQLPQTIFDNVDSTMASEMMALTTGGMANSDLSGQWDGLGLLIDETRMFLDDPRVLYCPCHHGAHLFHECAENLKKSSPLRVYGNYHFIGDTDTATGQLRILLNQSSEDVIVADGMRTASDLNHRTGTNTLRGDLSVRFWYDRDFLLRNAVENSSTDDPPSEETYRNLWKLFGRTVH